MQIVPDTLPPEIRLAERHQARLAALGIPLGIALAAGARTVATPGDLPIGIDADAAPGLAIGTDGHSVVVLPDSGGAYTPDAAPILLTLSRGNEAPSRVLVATDPEIGLAVAAHADPGWAVVALAASELWQDSTGPVASLLDLMGGGCDTTIVMSGDPSSERDEWDNLAALSSVLTSAGAGSVTWLRSPSGPLGSFLERSPAGTLARLVASAKAKPPRYRPKVAKRARVDDDAGVRPYVDEAGACVRGGGWIGEDGRPHPGPIILEGLAPRITDTEVRRDDLYPPDTPEGMQVLSHRMVAIDESGDELLVQGGPVADDLLASPRAWLARVEGGVGSTCSLSPEGYIGDLIADTIRTHRVGERNFVQAYPRTGWVVDQSGADVYLFHGGAMGPDGILRSSIGRIPYPLGWDDADLEADGAAAVRDLLDVSTALGRPELWWILMGLITHTLAGSPPAGALSLEGPRGAGKTTIAKLTFSVLGHRLIDGMHSASATENALGALGQGLHQAPCLVDDLPRSTNSRKLESIRDAVDLLFRRAYEPNVGRERMMRGVLPGRWDLAPKDRSRPQPVLSVDELPQGLAPTALDRVISVRVARSEDTWTERGAWRGVYHPMGASGRLQVAGAHILREIARLRAEAGGEASWLVALGGMPLADLLGEDWGSQRDEEAVRPYAVGLALLQQVCERIGVPELHGHLDAAFGALELVRGERVETKAARDPGDAILDACRSAVASGAFYLAGDRSEDAAPSPRALCMGAWTTSTANGKPTRAVALITEVVHRVAGTTTQRISQDLPGRFIVGPRNSTSHPARVQGTLVPCIHIPSDIWTGDEPDQD